MSIRDGDTAPLLVCHGGCRGNDVIAALRQRGLWDRTDNREPRPIRRERQPDPEPAPAAVEARARRVLCRAEPAHPDHPYLVRKGIKPHEARQRGDRLVLPLIRDARLRGLQFIRPSGVKVFLRGTRLKGAYWFLGDPTQGGRLVIAEGFATAASIHEATGLPTIIAFSANNLRSVAEYWRRIRPDVGVVAADADESGAGQRAAVEAATATRGRVALPQTSGGER